MKELSIFIDESGDFGEYDYHSPYYIITMIFHDQQENVQPAISKLNQELSYLSFVYTGISQAQIGKQYIFQIRENLLWKYS